MKKSKLLIPVLSIAGLGATVAPIVCMTSCSCSLVEFGVKTNCIAANISYDSEGNWVVSGSFINQNTDIDMDSSYVEIKFSNGAENPTFNDLKDQYIFVTVNGTSAEIKLLKTISQKYPDMTIKSITLNIKGDKENL